MRRALLVAGCVGLAVTLGGAFPGSAAVTALDPSFGTAGKTTILDSAGVGVVQMDGDTVIAAGTQRIDRRHAQVFVARLDDAGQLVAGFGDDGIRVVTGGERYYQVGLDVDATGRVLLAAQSDKTTAVFRLTSDGTLDTSFSGDGRRSFRVGATNLDLFPDVVTDSTGRILLGAMARRNPDNFGSAADVKVWRMLDDGTLDTSWSGDGVRIFDRADTDWFDAITVDSQDRVLVASDYDNRGYVYRLRQHGAWDPSFGDDGIVEYRLGRGIPTWTLAIGAGGGSITLAAAGYESGGQFGSVRLLPNGDLDPSYGDGGVVSVNCQTRCFPTWGDVEGGMAAIMVNGYAFEGDVVRLARIGKAGNWVQQMAVDPIDGKNGATPAVTIDGSRTVIGGYDRHDAFVARIG